MKFPAMFTRLKPATTGQITLGDDAVPAAGTGPTTQNNVLSYQFNNINGWPVHRIAVLYSGPSAAIALKSNLYFYDEATKDWHRINATVDQLLTPNVVAWFDVVALAERAPTLSNAGEVQGNLTVMLNVQTGSTPDGTYKFAMGADLTTF